MRVIKGGVVGALSLVCHDMSLEILASGNGGFPDFNGMIVFRGAPFGHFTEPGAAIGEAVSTWYR